MVLGLFKLVKDSPHEHFCEMTASVLIVCLNCKFRPYIYIISQMGFKPKTQPKPPFDLTLSAVNPPLFLPSFEPLPKKTVQPPNHLKRFHKTFVWSKAPVKHLITSLSLTCLQTHHHHPTTLTSSSTLIPHSTPLITPNYTQTNNYPPKLHIWHQLIKKEDKSHLGAKTNLGLKLKLNNPRDEIAAGKRQGSYKKP